MLEIERVIKLKAREIVRRKYKPLVWAMRLSFYLMLLSLFAWIWHCNYSDEIFFSGLSGFIVSFFFIKMVEEVVYDQLMDKNF